MATTTNFGWETPDDTDLVKDGAAAIRTLGSAIDTSLVDLKGGTTGQVLSKTSNTDMDFTWVTSDDANAIQNAIVDAKGDLIAASAADTPARLAVGNNGETLVADSSTSTGLRWQANYAAGKNAIINGDFGVWQRGTSFSNPATATYISDRWLVSYNGTGATRTISRQTFTAGAAPVAGYESQYFLRFNTSVAGTETQQYVSQPIEDVRTFAGKTITISYWAKADAGRTVTVRLAQNFGSGGSATVLTTGNGNTITTSWARYSETIAVPSISGKTIGTSSYISAEFLLGNSPSTFTFDIWGVQVEAGSVATAFQTATGTLQGELAACQRYYWRSVGGNAYSQFGSGQASSTTNAYLQIQHPVTMRVAPTSVDYSTLGLSVVGTSTTAITALSLTTDGNGSKLSGLTATVASGLTSPNRYVLTSNNSTTAYIGFSAEL